MWQAAPYAICIFVFGFAVGIAAALSPRALTPRPPQFGPLYDSKRRHPVSDREFRP